MSVLAKLRQAFNIIVGARNALIEKGETVEYDDDIPQIIEDMDTGGGADTETLKNLIERQTYPTTIIIPDGTIVIGNAAFYNFANLTNVVIPSSVKTISGYAFSGSSTSNSPTINNLTIPDTVTSLLPSSFEYANISYITIGSGVTNIPEQCFSYSRIIAITIPGTVKRIHRQAFMSCPVLTSITINHGVERIDDYCCPSCNSLTDLFLPNTLTQIGYAAFNTDSNLTNVTLENGFNANGLDLSVSTKYSAATIVSWLNALADRTGQTAYTLTIGSTNLAKLTSDQIAIATNKNWNLA